MYNNNCNFAGRIGNMKPAAFSATGTKIVNFSLAITKSVKDKNGQFNEKTSWINCTAFNGTADYLETKGVGTYVGIVCELQTRKYNDGQRDITVTEFIVNNVEALPSYWTKDANNSPTNTKPSYQQQAPSKSQNQQNTSSQAQYQQNAIKPQNQQSQNQYQQPQMEPDFGEFDNDDPF